MRKTILLFCSLVLIVGLAAAAGDDDAQKSAQPAKQTLQKGTEKKLEQAKPDAVVRPADKEAVDNRTGTTEPGKAEVGPPEAVSAPPTSQAQVPPELVSAGYRSGYEEGREGRGGERGRHGYPPPPSNPWRRGPDHRYHRHFWPVPIFIPFPVEIHHPTFHHRGGTGVYVVTDGKDPIGREFGYSLKEEIREVDLRPVHSSDDAVIELYVTSIDQDPEYPGTASSVSISYLWLPSYQFISAQVMNVTDETMDDIAASVASYVDHLWHGYR